MHRFGALMTKFLTRSFLSLSFLLLIGYSQLYAHACTDVIPHTSQVSEHNEEERVDVTRETGTIPRIASPEQPVLKFHVREVREKEEDEHEVKSLRKSVVSNKYIVAFFYGQIFTRFYQQIVPFSCRRHLLIRVLRI